MNLNKSIKIGGALLIALTNDPKNQIYNFFNKKKQDLSLQIETYLWGNGFYQSRPDQTLSFDNFEPKKIDNFKDAYQIKQIAFNEYVSAALTINSEVIFWKNHNLQSSKDPDINDNIRSFQKIATKNTISSLTFTKGFLWGLLDNGKVIQWPLQINQDLKKETTDITIGNERQVQSLSDIVQISGGYDHFVALNKDGKVYTMGDDTFGQCGINQKESTGTPPFFEKRIRSALLVEHLPCIKKVVSGHSHTLALSNSGEVYGWGSNQKVQLSHEKEYSRVESPVMAFLRPVKITHNLENNEVTDIAAGREHSIFVTRNKSIFIILVTDETEVFGSGHNLKGELGIGYLRHVADLIKIEGLSNFQIKKENGSQQVRVDQIVCGDYHCMAKLDMGVLMQWGNNEQGQLGNKKRSTVDHPVIINKFSQLQVKDIFAGVNKSGVLIQVPKQ